MDYDANWNREALEVVNPDRKPVLQIVVDGENDMTIELVTYKSPTEVEMCDTSHGCIVETTFKAKSWIENTEPLFHYPSWEHPGLPTRWR